MTRYWPQVQNILQLLMAMLRGQDDNGIDLFFTSSTKPYRELMEPWQVIDPLKDKHPKVQRPGTASVQRPDPTTDRDPDDFYVVLSHILNSIGSGNVYTKKTTLLILTDGVWPKSPLDVVARYISHWLLRMTTVSNGAADAVRHDRYYSIQFVQLGSDLDGTRVLEYLDDELKNAYPDVP